MDFFSGVFKPQPVILLISLTTSSAVARNSGLLVAADGAVAAGPVVACLAEGKGGEKKNKIPGSKKAKEKPKKQEKRGIKGQDKKVFQNRTKNADGVTKCSLTHK